MRKIVLALCILMVLAITGCGGDKGVNETGYSNEPLVDREGNELDSADAERLYKSAREFLVDGDPDRAPPQRCGDDAALASGGLHRERHLSRRSMTRLSQWGSAYVFQKYILMVFTGSREADLPRKARGRDVQEVSGVLR